MGTTLSDAWVQFTDHGDGSADFTVTFAEDDHRFSASAEDEAAAVEYEETLSWRGELRVSEPGETVFRALMVSDEMTEFLETYGLSEVNREYR